MDDLHVLTGIIHQLVSLFGIMGIFLGMLLESACIPFPSEVIMPLGGYLAESGKLVFWHVVLAGVAGNLCGSVLAYAVGRYGGRPLIEKYGRYIRLSVKHLDLAERWFERYGGWSVFFGRLLPVVRTFISLPAGIAKMPFARFVVYTVIGCLPWVWLWTWLGVKIGANLGQIKGWLDHLNILIVIVLVGVLAIFWVKGRKK